MKQLSRNSASGLLLFTLLIPAMPSFAANECKVQYGYHTGGFTNRVDHVKTEFLNVNQTKTINQSNLNFVQNLKNNKVRIRLEGAVNNNFTLSKNDRNPTAGFYLTQTKLKTIKCLNQTTEAAFGSPEALITAFKNMNKSANQIAKALKDTFNTNANNVAKLLRQAGFTAQQTAAAIKSQFNASLTQVGGWLKTAGYAGSQVAAALKNAYNATAQQVTSVLKSVYNASMSQAGQWLRAAGYAGSQVAAALKNAYNATAEQVTSVLKSVYNASITQVAQWLRAAGYAGAQIAAALQHAYNATAEQVASALKSAFNASITQVATWLKDAGYAYMEAAKALKRVFNATAQQVAETLKNVFQLSTKNIAKALLTAGYALIDVAKVLETIGTNPEMVVRILKELSRPQCGVAGCRSFAQTLKEAGYAAGEVIKALKKHFRISKEAAHEIATKVFRMNQRAAEQLLAQAGYGMKAAERTLRAVPATTARTAQTVTNAVVNPTSAGVNIRCVVNHQWVCRGAVKNPTVMNGVSVEYGSNRVRFRIEGLNLQGVDAIRGLPARNVSVNASPQVIAASANLRYSGRDWRGPTSGTAQLMSKGKAVPGGTFRWDFGIHRTQPVQTPPGSTGAIVGGGVRCSDGRPLSTGCR